MQTNAVDIIGEISPMAKEKILSGEVQIEDEVLEDIATASNEAIAEIARRIENGTYNISSETQHQWEMIISSVTGEYFHGMQDAAKSGSAAKLKNALRAYIIQLEDLYRQL